MNVVNPDSVCAKNNQSICDSEKMVENKVIIIHDYIVFQFLGSVS